MADLALRSANAVRPLTLTTTQHTVVAGEAITAGAPCYLDATTGKAYNSDANDGARDMVWGIALRTVTAGEAITLLRRGPLGGVNVDAVPLMAPIFVSNTVGTLSDTAGTASIAIGHVIPVFGEPIGGNPAREIMVECPEITA